MNLEVKLEDIKMEYQEPSCSSSSTIRNPSGKYVRSEQRKIVVNLYQKIIAEKPSIKYRIVMARLSEISGIGLSTVKRIIAEYKNTGKVSSPKTKRKRRNAIQKLSDEEKHRIRQKVHDFWFRREVPNLNKMLRAVNADPALNTYGRTTLHTILRKLNFQFKAKSRNSALMEKDYIVLWRHKYLSKLAQYRSEGRHIYYLDETWINAGDCKRELWVDSSVKSAREAKERGLSTDIPEPTGKGKRLIVLHIGSTEGFVPGGLLFFESKENLLDYHDEIDGDTFFEWFRGVLPSLKEGSVIIMNNAPYHSVKMERCPTMCWTKPQIIDWLESKGQTIPPLSVKVELIDMVKKLKPLYDKNAVDEYAKQNGKEILRLPPYHCELNPMNMVWAMVKKYVKTQNTTYKLADVKQLLIEGIKGVSVEYWKDFVRHTVEEEQKFIELDQIVDEINDINLLQSSIPDDASEESQTDSNEEST
ncbi:PREDICTED: uncharacterized protein LOC108578925 [Habropoda laboriosa]|uniref:uncharacterized protein LOC108578925 n=1 Tax=Habropoda laboriosa TaxID=597456 RepID=UPI00083D2D32|nr:PREDICTED: uncharacterized protein LOC108578925 [Habropoda laboriosa]